MPNHHRDCFDVPSRLHRLLRQSELPDFPQTPEALIETIFTHTGSEIGWPICHALQRYLPPDKSRITGLRVSVAFSFMNDDMICVMVEWRERSGADILAIFDVNAVDPNRCSYILHYGFDANLNAQDQFRWNRTSILWNLAEMADLQTLLEAAQHVLGILQMPRSDLEVLYGGDQKQNCSKKEYLSADGRC